MDTTLAYKYPSYQTEVLKFIIVKIVIRSENLDSSLTSNGLSKAVNSFWLNASFNTL